MSPKKNQTLEELHTALESVYVLHRLGDHQAAEELVVESNEKLEKSELHRSLHQLIHHIGLYEQNIFQGEAFSELLPTIKSVVNGCGINLYLGWMNFLSGYYLKEAKFFSEAAKYFQDGSHTQELYEVYYWMDNFRLLPSEEKYITFLRTYPVKTIYSLIKGNQYFIKELSPLTQLQKDQAKTWLSYQEEEDFDCWHITQNTIVPAKYTSIDQGEESCLDIYSGLLNDRGEILYLFFSELNCLSYLIAAQLTGAPLNELAEFLGRTEQDTLELMEDIKKIGIKIKKEKGNYFIQWECKPNIIIPRSLKVIGLHEFVKKKTPSFTKIQLIEMLQLTLFGAESLMKKWALAGLIQPVEVKNNENIWKFL